MSGIPLGHHELEKFAQRTRDPKPRCMVQGVLGEASEPGWPGKGLGSAGVSGYFNGVYRGYIGLYRAI